jgi:hypothetical protein
MAWWNDPRLDDEGTYDYLVEELPDNSSKWSWYLTKCDDCGKERRLNLTDTSYFYCWDGWDSMSYTTCWRCYLKCKVRSIISKAKKNMLKHCRKLNVGAYIVFRKFCKKNNIAKEHHSDLWSKYYDYWTDKSNYKFLRGMVK